MDAASRGSPSPVPRDESLVIRLQDMGLMPALDHVPAALEAIVEAGPRTVVVDMSELSRLSSTTVAALLLIKRRCRLRGTEVFLRSPSSESLAMLQRVGLVTVTSADPSGAWPVAEEQWPPLSRESQCGTR